MQKYTIKYKYAILKFQIHTVICNIGKAKYFARKRTIGVYVRSVVCIFGVQRTEIIALNGVEVG